MTEMPDRIVLFDGVCNFCDGAVQFIIKHDPKGLFSFASLQSDIGGELLKHYQLPTDHFDSFILIKEGRVYQKSSAALHVLKSLPGLWRSAAVFLIIPRPLRDAVYSLIAKNRYKWFGQKNECMIPGPDIRKRFLS
ncbi:thiol-disulfide oxidoreductase DCC family protein [Bacillus swezeyi]|uniref:Thiol-disulfide oxidoreductase n=1 Tax=Bacillus swezeyi TaxID=1925020 RepID=A0A1R1QE41_9BACI|nr:thiol-disulfide oxidoreductase DCC family protein [Bacillus swezeyi]MEC1262204.1 thiol-disulfide oxidoreductase DCC family protein [Bacillus swezeyi]MED2927228.1 thiol-disulfide oxidoreductase DCC family protein [Bacillus swezeyi]MED2962426.1 thiol-disulfide oxidoreductase DCC family protein [Bacillus swezeyi]MED3072119.1 thiol-disulfide oxidoreductase DCC family protein [Bacillus swezeyi]MED3082597.1 thiol-disulfide oxidoreductase DCC family protein [Bacillus swezeyi]